MRADGLECKFQHYGLYIMAGYGMELMMSMRVLCCCDVIDFEHRIHIHRKIFVVNWHFVCLLVHVRNISVSVENRRIKTFGMAFGLLATKLHHQYIGKCASTHILTKSIINSDSKVVGTIKS